MSALVQTAGAAIAFLSENRLNRHVKSFGDYSCTPTGSAYFDRLYDMVPESYFITEGSSDSITEVIEFGLYNSGGQGAFPIGVIAVLGNTLKNFKVEYSTNNGASWSIFTGLNFPVGSSDNTTEDLIASLASDVTDVNRIKVTMWTVRSGTEKQIAELYIGNLLLQPTTGFSKYNPDDNDDSENVHTVICADGSKDELVYLRAATGDSFWKAIFRWTGLSRTNRDLLKDFKRAYRSFIVLPEPGDVPGDIYYARWVPGSFRTFYLEGMGALALYTAVGELEELGHG